MESREASIVEFQLLPQDFLIFVRRASDIWLLGFHAVHIRLRYSHAEEQFAARHAIVAVRMLRRNGALVTPEDVHLAPVYLASEFVGGEHSVHRSRGVAPR